MAGDRIGELVRRWRVAAHLTQLDLGRLSGISVRSLRDIEQHRVRPRDLTAQRLADALSLAGDQRVAFLTAARQSVRRDGPEVLVLGPLTVHRDGVPVEVSAALRRDLLGLLAVQNRQVVPIAEIVEVLWADPPATYASQLTSLAGALRRLLESGRAAGRSSRVLVRSGIGYRLDLDEDRLDLARFDRLVADHEVGDQLAGHRQALELWRGPVLAGAGPALSQHPAVVAVGRRLVMATLAFADAALAQHRAAEVVPFLYRATAHEPLHEGLHARLMAVLAAAGEQATALRVFADLRARLDRELGVRPGPDLEAARTAVLRGLSSTPAQLPRNIVGFTGRRGPLQVLDRLLSDGPTGGPPPVAVIGGPPGVGKSALAVHWAHRVADRFPDGQLYVNLRGFDHSGRVVDPTEAIRDFLTALGAGPHQIPSGPDAQVALYRSMLAGRRVLILLDNARDAAHVRPLLPGNVDAVALVTSRNRLTGLVAADGARPVELGVLSDDEARGLLIRRLGDRPVTSQERAARQVIAACGGLPLALTITAARAQQTRFSLTALAAELTDGRLDALDAGDAVAQVRAVFSWSYTALSAPVARLFRLLGLHPGPDISAAAAASLAGEPLSETRGWLAELSRASLLVERSPGRYAFHDLLRVYAVERCAATDSSDQRQAAVLRLFDHYLHTSVAAMKLMIPTARFVEPAPARPGVVLEVPGDSEWAQTWFSAERPVLLALVDPATSTGFESHVWQLSRAMWTFLHRRGLWHDQAAAGAAAVAAASRLADPAALISAHRLLGQTYAELGRLDDAEAQLRHSLHVAVQAGDRLGQAQAHHALGHLGYLPGWRGDPEVGLDHTRQSLELYRLAKHRGGQAGALNAVGWYHAKLGRAREALAFCRQALALHEELGHRSGQAASWDSLGVAHHRLGEYAEAKACYGSALALSRELGDRFDESDTLSRLGDTHLADGDPSAARDAWSRALRILTDLGHPDSETVRAKLSDVDRLLAGPIKASSTR